MAKGDTFNVVSSEEIEISFQLNLKRAELAKRNDADQHTHVLLEFTPEFAGNTPPNAEVKFFALDAGSVGDGKFDPFPITTDDPKFVRLFKVGVPTTLDGRPLDDLLVRVNARLVPKDGAKGAPTLPRDSELCKIRIRSSLAPKPPTR